MPIFNSEYKVPDGYFPRGIYHNSTDGVISLSSDGVEWITISDKNLGATTVWNSGDTLSENNCGKYYQWGNNYGFPRTGNVTTSNNRVYADNYGPGNYYSSSTFICVNGNWALRNTTNLRGGDTGTVEATQGPSPSGFHVPLINERKSVVNIRTELGGGGKNAFGTVLKLPFAGRRISTSAEVDRQSGYGHYWTSSPSSGYSYYIYFYNGGSSVYTGSADVRAFGYSVRCFKNVPVIPTSSWTKLY